MKKRSGAQRAVPILPLTELERMTTKQLLGRLARLRHCADSLELSDVTSAEAEKTLGILFKSDPHWRAAHAELKELLARREHVGRREKLPGHHGKANTPGPAPRKRGLTPA